MAEQLKEPGISDCAPTLARAASPGFPTERVVPLLIGATVEEVERELVLQTLVHCHGNRTRAANVLGVSIRTLRNKIKDYAAQGLAVVPPGHDRFGGDDLRAPRGRN